jgi:hypothetical protein
MSQDRLLRFMVSMTNALENMEMLTCGSTSLIFLICSHLQQLLKERYSVFMVVSRLVLTA